MSQFYLTLPSNASMNVYPNNTVAQYTTKLANTVELDGDWEVGLVEIIYVHTWENVRSREYEVSIKELTNGLCSGWFRAFLPSGYYHSGKELAEEYGNIACIRQSPGIKTNPKFKFNERTNKMSIVVPRDTELQLSGDGLLEMTGFVPTKDEENGEEDDYKYVRLSNPMQDELTFTSAHAIDVKCGFYSLYIYCDVLGHMHVGDTRAPLLRAIAVRGKHGEAVHEIFSKVTYIPLQKKVFDSIEINIMTDTGKPVPFVGGKSLVTLHFRRSSNPYLLSK